MDFGIRELLMLVGALIFIGVLLDGVRRFKDNRSKQIKLDVIRDSKVLDDEDEDDDWFSAELPNGKARIRNIIQDDEEEGKIAPRFSEPVDILMEGSSFGGSRRNVISDEDESSTHSSYNKNSYSETDNNEVDFDNENPKSQASQEISAHEEQFAPILKNNFTEDKDLNINHQQADFGSVEFGNDDAIDDGIIGSARVREKQNTRALAHEVREPKRKNTFSELVEENAPKISAKKPTINQGDLFVGDSEEVEDESATNDLPEEVLSVNVIAKKGQVIDGQALLDAVQSFGLRFGDMDIFHRHENASGHGPVIFSMANAINPGTFNIDELPDMQIRGVTFFMRLSTINKRTFVLELMVDIAKRLSNQLGAELKDDTHSVLSSQTVAHYKSRIQEYERRYLGQVLRK